jgi:hypothetical protein
MRWPLEDLERALAPSLSERQRRSSRIAGLVVGAILSLGLLVVAPMYANYRDHGSVFIKQK